MERSKNFLLAAAGLWALLLMVWPSSFEEHNATATTASRDGLYRTSLTKANIGLLGMNYYESKANRKHCHVESEFAELHRKENYAFLRSVVARFFSSRNGNVVLTKSDFGRTYIDKNEIELERNVSIQSRRGYLFTLNKLRYRSTPHELYSNDEIQMKGPSVKNPEMVVRGVGLVGNVDREYFNVLSRTRAQRKLKTGEWLKINSSNGEFWTEDQKALFGGRVHSLLPKAEIDSDQLELSISQDRELIRAIGNVVVRNRERIGKAELAFIEVGNSQIVLEGKASIDTKTNKLRGNRIKIYNDDDRIEVEGAEGRMMQ